MSAAAVQISVPLHQEGTQFWQKVIEHCRNHVEAINRAALSGGISPDSLVQLTSEPEIRMRKAGYPSTEVKASLSFFSWGPVIQCKVSGFRDANHSFLTKEFEIPIGRDLDGEVVGIYDEGRSFCPRDVACYLTQSFRVCFPSVALPCGQPPEPAK